MHERGGVPQLDKYQVAYLSMIFTLSFSHLESFSHISHLAPLVNRLIAIFIEVVRLNAVRCRYCSWMTVNLGPDCNYELRP